MSNRVGSDRFLSTTTRTLYLMEREDKREAQAKKKARKPSCNDDKVIEEAGAVGRVFDEYFKTDKVIIVHTVMFPR